MDEKATQGGGYSKVELTMSAGKANLYALFFILPILLLYIPAYILAWPEQFSFSNLTSLVAAYKAWLLISPVIMMAVFILGAVVHEMLHGFTWAVFCKRGLKSIKYGVYWAMLTPYCHCQEVLPLRAYILGGIMPGLVMGLLPAIAGLLLGNFLVFLFGLFFSMAAGGDLLVLWMLRHQKKKDLVQDHPDKIGCFVLEKI
ncbi:hypothetical protein ABID22_002030 [Pontibacter aydingkolensis]|uniref:DUF3267 domain-containing protein n=1 Tax=Pontibacter aydingkolensis TaxID=1911536 RepID=A0ABS7CUW4_9BACT|nr:DUF3267 domain-containing protein [Pontibacter aydingkolensis]MBW7467646.1 DUF3267 domain-containing protein [Pontibacter aydingkolensis]